VTCPKAAKKRRRTEVPLPPFSSPGAISGYNSNSKIDLACITGANDTAAYATAVARVPKRIANSPKENTMNRRTTLAMTTTALFCLALGLSARDSLAQQRSLKEQLVGTWTLVSSDQVRPDGSKWRQFGANPKGINVFDANDRFFLMIASADNSKIASNNPNETNSEEQGGLIVEAIAYYGTYTVSEAEKVVFLHLDASTFPNQIGTDQKRTITSLTADELKYSYPATTSGVRIHQVWKRAE
jgi:Lipocalin-like domain